MEDEDFGAFSGVPLPDPKTVDGAMRIVRSVKSYHAVPTQAYHVDSFTLLKELERRDAAGLSFNDDYANAIS
jgi:hypothetical protein